MTVLAELLKENVQQCLKKNLFFKYLLLQLQHLPVLLALPVSEFLRVLPHLSHQLCTLGLHSL